MGLRFQKRLQVFPGVRLNFSRSGVSATIGVRGASVTLGRHGADANLGLPGSGLSYRKRVARWGQSSDDARSAAGHETVMADDGVRGLDESPDTAMARGLEAVESQPVDDLQSAGLDDLHDLIEEVGQHRRTVRQDLADAIRQQKDARKALRQGSVWWRRLAFPHRIPALTAACEEADADVATLQETLKTCAVEVELGLDRAVLDAFVHLAEAFDGLRQSSMIWDVTASRDDGRLDSADVDRHEVSFFFADSGVLNCPVRAMVFGNANGADMHLYPAFALLRDGGDGFALIDPRDMVISYHAVSFVEDGALPADSRVIGQGWEKVTRSGDRDRRYSRHNRQWPTVLYGSLAVYTREGLNERWLVSNAAAAEGFARAWVAFQKSLPPLDSGIGLDQADRRLG